jgi:TolB-like protein/Flp pilus assembly protein TadD
VANQNSRSSVGVVEEQPLPPEGIRAQLERILSSDTFSRSGRLVRFLRFSVEQALSGNGDCLKEQIIGIQVFDRKSDYDPRIDPIVRVEARRLRSKLKTYYLSHGRSDRVVIGLPKGTYVPFFRSRATAPKNSSSAAAPLTAPTEKSIAVLPFTNLTPEADDDYFSDGLTEELIHRLTRIPDFRVVAWETMSRLRGREQDPEGIRRELKVRSILRGSVRRTNGRVRVTAQLVDGESGAYLWSEAYDRELQDVFAIQEEMARAIVDTLQLTLRSSGFRRGAGKEPGPECYMLCLQGRFHANKRTRDGLLKSITCFQQAIAAEETCAVAYAGVADAYSLLADHSFLDPAEAALKARAAAETALNIDPDCAEAHVSLAFIRAVFDWAWADAEPLFRRAIELNPGYARAHHWFTDVLSVLGRLDEALSEARTAHHLDPLSQIIWEGCGWIHMLRREYALALHTYQQLVEFDSTFYKAHSSMGRVLSLMGRYPEAIAAFERARSLSPDAISVLAALGQTLALEGRTDEALQILEQLQHLSRTHWVPAAAFAVIHLGLGDREKAIQYCETAVENRERTVTGFRVHPMWEPLHGEPRFQALLQRAHLLP